MGVESYLHRYAKQTLASWLREASKGVDRATFGPLCWRVNRPAPSYGIWEEYPVSVDGLGLNPVWDEWSFQDTPDGLLAEEAWHRENRPPTREELISNGCKPSYIFDVAVQHKGMIVFGLEVVHKNPISASKLKRIRSLLDAGPVAVYQIPAQWILSQVGVPTNWGGERVL